MIRDTDLVFSDEGMLSQVEEELKRHMLPDNSQFITTRDKAHSLALSYLSLYDREKSVTKAVKKALKGLDCPEESNNERKGQYIAILAMVIMVVLIFFLTLKGYFN